jgi:hypothetical protein
VAAIGLLGAFIEEVKAYVSDGILSEDRGQPLLDLTNRIVRVLGG